MSYAAAASLQTLVLVDLQPESIDEGLEKSLVESALERCREAVIHARLQRIPIAYVRNAHGRVMPRSSTHWIEGFEPIRDDMIFEREKLSCYSSARFAEVLGNKGQSLVIAGFMGETTCLSTTIEASQRGQKVIYLSDASVSSPLAMISSAESHRFIAALAQVYGNVLTTRDWISKTSTRVKERL